MCSSSYATRHPAAHFLSEPVRISNTAYSAQELGYYVVLVRDAIAMRDIPSADGKSRIPAAQVMEVVCAELADAVATVIWSKEIMA